MDTDPSTSALDLFDELVDLPRDQRTRYLTAHCDDAQTRREIESLLAAYDDAGGFFSEPARRRPRRGDGDGDDAADDGEPHAPGTRVGHYELLEPLGEGGFARVYRARQHHPVRRDVALKLIKPGMDTRQVLARFELERQALAMMDHPGIAAVYDAGVTDAARPYFVMELVRGPRINQYCDARGLDARQRVRLFADVCRAVHHAHTKGILHRDLKPSNVLVTEVDGRAVPKVIDFGIAKATQEKLTDATIVTHERQFLGTPQYMSPEQASSGGADVDTRSDIYSLGAVLYELLTGTSPLDEDRPTSGRAPSSQLEQLQRLTSDRPVTRPSARAGDAARRRELRGELDWVVGACLEKDRARRYDSAAALADDLQAYLERRPVKAAPPALSYRARRFVRRNALPVAAAALLLAALLAGTVVSAAQAVRARRAERLAQRRLLDVTRANENLQAVHDFLAKDMIGSADPAVTRGRELTVREALDNAAAAVPEKFKGRPLNEAVVRRALATSYLYLGRADLALPHAERALAQFAGALGPAHADAISSRDHVATILRRVGRAAEAEPLARAAVDLARAARGPDDQLVIQAMCTHADALDELGRAAEAVAVSGDALDRARRGFGDDHELTLRATNTHASALLNAGRAADAEPLYRAALEGRRRARGADHPDTITSLSNYAGVLRTLGRYADAEPHAKQALEIDRRVHGDDHPGTLTSINNYGLVLRLLGRHAEAEPFYREALERRRRVLGDDHPETLASINNYASLLRLMNRPADAEPMFREVLDKLRGAMGEDHPHTITTAINLASTLDVLGRFDEAEPLFRDALARRRRVQGSDHPDTLKSLENYASSLRVQHRDADAEPLLAELYDAAARAQVAPRLAATFMADYGPVLTKLGKYEQAEPVLRDAHRRLSETNQSTHPKARAILAALADVCDHTNRPEEAARWRAALDAARAATQPATLPTAPP